MPVSSPSYFPPSRANGTVVGITAGVSTTGARNFLAQKGAGNYTEASDLIIIGDSAMSAGTEASPVVDTALEYSVVIGSSSVKNYTGNSSASGSGPIIIIGGNNFPQAIGILHHTIAIGTGIAPNLVGYDPTNSASTNIFVGHDILTQMANYDNQLNFYDNVIIGNSAVAQSGNELNIFFENTIIGCSAGYNLTNQGGGACAQNTFIGFGAGNAFVGNLVTGNVALGYNAGGSSYANNSNTLLLGMDAGISHGTSATNYICALESNGHGCLFAQMDGGNVALGDMAGSSYTDQRTFPANATNILKLINGTAGTANPLAGGYFYVSAGALHWVGSNGTDTQIAPA